MNAEVCLNFLLTVVSRTYSSEADKDCIVPPILRTPMLARLT